LSAPVFVDIREILAYAKHVGASDIHLKDGHHPRIRLHGSLLKLQVDELNPATKHFVEKQLFHFIQEDLIGNFYETNELDCTIEIEKIGRFRVNVFRAMKQISAVLRIIPTTVPTLEELKSPEIFSELIKREKGLILVTGATGSGKSTTIAAMIDAINRNYKQHIVTIEDPIEFVHQNKSSFISQREINFDTNDFKSALKSLLRQDPNTVLIGEMRDLETIGAGLTIAETGHLVFGTLHTNSAPQSINRIIDVFDTGKQNQIRMQLSTTLVAIVSQILIPKVGGGRKAIFEILINNSAVSNLIREGQIHQIYSVMQTNQNETGMRTQTQELIKSVSAGEITVENAIKFSNNRGELIRALQSLKLI